LEGQMRGFWGQTNEGRGDGEASIVNEMLGGTMIQRSENRNEELRDLGRIKIGEGETVTGERLGIQNQDQRRSIWARTSGTGNPRVHVRIRQRYDSRQAKGRPGWDQQQAGGGRWVDSPTIHNCIIPRHDVVPISDGGRLLAPDLRFV
jgi:hypothetical protein